MSNNAEGRVSSSKSSG